MTSALHDPLLDATPRALQASCPECGSPFGHNHYCKIAADMRAASPVTITALDAAYADFLLALTRPRPLRVENSNAALRGRIDEIERHIAAFKAWLTALVEDTAQNVALAKRPDDIVDSHMTDMAGDLRGQLLQALERNAA